MPHFTNRISWRGVAGQFLGNPWVTDLETMLFGITIEYPVYRVKSEHSVQHVVLQHLLGRGRLADLDDRTQPLDMQDPYAHIEYKQATKGLLEPSDMYTAISIFNTHSEPDERQHYAPVSVA
ncbi:hypothetical protein TNCV_889021 [Trichonephila clavipes]|nr:hypothetical protein TNCV_889021 [Trichonephila clavipes]